MITRLTLSLPGGEGRYYANIFLGFWPSIKKSSDYTHLKFLCNVHPIFRFFCNFFFKKMLMMI